MTVAPRSRKKTILLLGKVGFSIAMLFVIFRKVVLRDGSADLFDRLSRLEWGWVVAAVLMQLIAICFSTVRWQRLLYGQGIHAPWRFLGGSILIARFWGAFTPGGFTGFGGWRIYDVAKHTGKTARATATIGVEMVLGQLAFGAVVMAGSVFGARFIGLRGVLLVNLLFVGIVTIGVLFLSRPQWFLFVTRWLPDGARTRVQTLVDAVNAYQGRGGLLLQAAVLGVGTHAFNNLIYVCAARALGVELSVGEVFFASSLQILATLVPASINGIGLREAAAVALYTSPLVGLPLTVAVLIPTLGFACEMFVSAFGGLIFMARRGDYAPQIGVDDPDREQNAQAAIAYAPESDWPSVTRGARLGFGAGLMAGVLVGLGEALVIRTSSNVDVGVQVVFYGVLAYGTLCAVLGLGGGALSAYSGRLMRRRRVAEPDAFAAMCAALVAGFAFVLGAFRLRRDFFHEELAWKSLEGLGVLAGVALAALLLFVGLALLLRALVRRHPAVATQLWGAPLMAAVVSGTAVLAVLIGMQVGGPVDAGLRPGAAPDGQGNILFIVVDTLRADHLPGYGYEKGNTPHLDAFAADAIRFDQFFANASWTRPSFASLLTGRLPSSHGVMAKSDALPADVITLPEVLRGSGYSNAGFVTNFNVAPYFDFGQGFDSYRFLEPEFVLGADDASAKLLLLQIYKRVAEKITAASGRVVPGSAYQDAETVNAALFSWLDGSPRHPWFLFAAYMDPHDPYFEHPYSGSGYSRAAHQHPDPDEADALRRLYDGEISYWDTHFGALMAQLKARGVYDDLTIVVTSDHGEEFYDHGGYWHGTTLYDEQVRVPLYLKLPKARRGGTVVRHWAQSIDIMPTLLKLQGLDVPGAVQGGDLFLGVDKIYAEESHEGNQLESIRELRGTDEIKLISANPGNPRGLKAVELYRVDDDPREQDNLADTEAETVAAAMRSLAAARHAAEAGAAVQVKVGLDEDVAKRLEALGYMEK